MSYASEETSAGRPAWRKFLDVPLAVPVACAALSVALACIGADRALAFTKAYGTGALACLAALSVAVCSRMVSRPFVLALHLGFSLVLGGWVLNEISGGEEGSLTLAPGRSGDVAGVEQLTLDAFTIDRWEDTGAVRQYTSKVRNAKGEELSISVNHPAVFGQWWVYQNSYQEMQNPHTGEPFYLTVLLCVRDVGLPIAAFGAALLMFGALGYAFAFTRKTRPAEAATKHVPPRALTVLYGLAFLGAAAMLVHRGLATGHPPMQNMYEFLMCTAAMLPMLTFVSAKLDGQNTMLVDSALLALVTVPVAFFMDGSVKRLMPALQSPFFVPHVGAYVIGYVLLVRAAFDAGRRLAGVGFFLLTLGLVLGAAWGKICWGHWWQFDPKEMWSLATWLLYVAYFHVRGRLSARADRAFLVAGAAMIVLTLTWINLSRLFTGMHSYA